MIQKLTDLLPLLVTRLKNCPPPMQMAALRFGFRNWCEQSQAWRDTIIIEPVSGRRDFDLNPRYDAEVRYILSGGVRLRTQDDVTNNRPGFIISPDAYDATLFSGPLSDRSNDLASAGTATEATTSGVAKLRLRDIPASSYVRLEVDVILVPMLDMRDERPLSILNYAAKGILAGALSYLYGMEDKPWFNKAGYQIEAANFTESTTLAWVDAERGGTYAPLVTKPPAVF